MTSPKEPSYATAAAVNGLAREVEGLRNAVEPMKKLPGQVDDLATTVRKLAETTAATPITGGAPSWLDLPADLDRVQAVLIELTGWLREVFLRYADAVAALPECWLWHADVVEELLWLMYAWLGAYRDEDATVARAGDWHDRYRPGVVKRIKSATSACSLENHQPGGARHTGSPIVPLADAMAPLATWWATQRGETAPEPTVEQLAVAAAAPRRTGGGRR
ncbi:hypothetical protein [Amycolatopsis sp. H20-H5]|uniref:hypothetical protein n=1 Tax=Amycolatopsis sp. H20-H5 TaxID=3046309 RepID=UPI002DB9F624|nr:hypothetical protein [Amycolatopsis sp. H20-H5]MEC3976241.1 hypothetical protein [Amycolatopsis sp. H20-H5]